MKTLFLNVKVNLILSQQFWGTVNFMLNNTFISSNIGSKYFWWVKLYPFSIWNLYPCQLNILCIQFLISFILNYTIDLLLDNVWGWEEADGAPYCNLKHCKIPRIRPKKVGERVRSVVEKRRSQLQVVGENKYIIQHWLN